MRDAGEEATTSGSDFDSAWSLTVSAAAEATASAKTTAESGPANRRDALRSPALDLPRRIQSPSGQRGKDPKRAKHLRRMMGIGLRRRVDRTEAKCGRHC